MELTEEQRSKLRQKYGQSTNQTTNTSRISRLREIAGKSTQIDTQVDTVDNRGLFQKTLDVGQEFQEKPQEEKGIGRKIFDFFTKSEQAFGDTLGQTFASRGIASDITDKATQDLITSGNRLITMASSEQDPERKEKLLNMAKQDLEMAGVQWKEVLPAIEKTSKQIFGEGLGVATDIAAFGQYSKAFQPLSKLAGGNAKKAFVQGALAQVPQAATIGAGFGVSGALQEDKTIGETIKSGVAGGITGGVLGAIIGGFGARAQFKKPEKIEALRQKAIEQYKRGLNATKEKYKEKADKIIPDLLDKKWWGTRKKLMEKAESGVALSRAEYQKIGELKGVTEIKGLLNTVDDEIGKLTSRGGEVASVNRAKVKALSELKADILSVDAFDKIKDNVASQQALRELAQQYGDIIYESRRSQKTITDNATLSQVKKVDSAIRKLLNQDPRNIKYSEINKVNKLSSTLADILEETAKRTGNHKWLNVIRSLSFGGGAVTGAVVGGAPGVVVGGLGIGVLTEILNSTWWNTMRAVQKSKLADKLVQKSGQELTNALILLSRQGVKALNKL